jgi:hypothetical protein
MHSISPNALAPDRCQVLIDVYEEYAAVARQRDQFGNAIVYFADLFRRPEAGELLDDAVRPIVEAEEVRGVLGDVRLETACLARLGPGHWLPAHADNCRKNDAGIWELNHTPDRHLSALYYLNDDFDGGEIVFPEIGLSYKPERGSLLFFESGHGYVHEVRPVISGYRYSMPLWFTASP